MSFAEINKIEKSQAFIDIAFKKAAQTSQKKMNGPDNVFRARRREIAKLEVIKDTLTSKLEGVMKNFPVMDDAPEFYRELMRITIDVDNVRKSLATVAWAKNKVYELTRMFSTKIIKYGEKETISKFRNSYMGRVSSVLKRIDPALRVLEETRWILKDYPIIKTDSFTVCISGFPNVGKSTLLGKLTTSKPEIKNYAFTTKRLNLGYMKTSNGTVQFIDTPGTLARPDKMNNIERQAYLAIKYQASVIVFIFDLTDTYPMEQQEKLLEIMKEFGKPIIIYLSKTDIMDEERFKLFAKKNKAFYDAADLKEEIIKMIPKKEDEE